jgi:hypothetical protein
MDPSTFAALDIVGTRLIERVRNERGGVETDPQNSGSSAS